MFLPKYTSGIKPMSDNPFAYYVDRIYIPAHKVDGWQIQVHLAVATFTGLHHEQGISVDAHREWARHKTQLSPGTREVRYPDGAPQ